MNYLAEAVGTMLLIILGDGVVANVLLNKSKGQGSGWIVIATGWGLAVAIAVYAVGRISGAHLNPAVTVALASIGAFQWADVPGYVLAQMLGAFAGAIVVWLAYLPHWRQTTDADAKLAVFLYWPRDSTPVRKSHDRGDRHGGPGLRRARHRRERRVHDQPWPGSTCQWSFSTDCSRFSSECSFSASACHSAARPATRSIRLAISDPVWRTACCRFPASGTRIGTTPGFRSWDRSSVASWAPGSSPRSDSEVRMARYVGAIDQGTTSSRFIVFDEGAASSDSINSSTARSCRVPAGSSTIRSRS